MLFKYLLGIMLIAPILSSLLLGLIPNMQHRFVNLIGVGSKLISLICAYILLFKFDLTGKAYNLNFYHWLSIASIDFTFGFCIDKITIMMLVMVTSIAFLVEIFTIGYMHDDKSYKRFFCYLSMFSFFMLWLVVSNNLLQLFIGWEGVGLVSYLLIGFWYTKPSAIKANIKAFLINRFGDAFLLAGIVLCYVIFNSVHFVSILDALPSLIGKNSSMLFNILTFLFFIGAMAKSAQAPLHLWLPDSMEGPTPISALIHAATMVTAGIYLVVRLSPLFDISLLTLEYIMWTGTITSIMFGLVAIYQNDIKKIIAYSTISQLGYMVAALGLANFDNAMFHLFTHAFFKAGLFLGAGAIIHSMHHEQNIFAMGGLKHSLPKVYYPFLLTTLSLVGVPGFSGFYSKQAILTAAHVSNVAHAHIIYQLLLFGVFLTSIYSFRLFIVVFHGSSTNKHVEPVSNVLFYPVLILSICAVFLGGFYIGKDWAILMLHGILSMKTVLILVGLLLTWFFYIKMPKYRVYMYCKFLWLNRIFEYKFGFDWILYNVINKGYMCLAQFVDQKIIDQFFVMSAKSLEVVSTYARKIHTGYIYHYALIIMLACCGIWFWLMKTQMIIGV